MYDHLHGIDMFRHPNHGIPVYMIIDMISFYLSSCMLLIEQIESLISIFRAQTLCTDHPKVDSLDMWLIHDRLLSEHFSPVHVFGNLEPSFVQYYTRHGVQIESCLLSLKRL